MLRTAASKETARKISSVISKWKGLPSEARGFYTQSQQIDVVFADRLHKAATESESRGMFSSPSKMRGFSSSLTPTDISKQVATTDKSFAPVSEDVHKEAEIATEGASKGDIEQNPNFEILPRSDFRDIKIRSCFVKN